MKPGEYLGRRQRIDTTPRYDDRLHTVTGGDRIDLLAHSYLGDARLWWIICDYNDIFFPLELTPGTDLRIPSVEHVQMRLLD
jgi:nucleoid-associated protein YgaU